MPTNVRIIHAKDFIRATPEGKLDLEESKSVLLEIASIGGTLIDFEVILDTRKARSTLSVSDLWHLAAELSKVGKAFRRKTAVLCPFERFNQAEFFEVCARNRGFRVKAFTSFEDAIEWLTQ